MSKGSSSRARRPLPLLAIVAVLGMAMTLTTVGTAASSPGHAVAAKKCKKKKGKKKKKCKKKKVAVLPAPGPLVRGTISWPFGDVDLHAFDASGNHTGLVPPGVVQLGIPNTSFSGDAQTGGSESVTDLVYVVGGPANRELSFLACFYNTTSATFTGVSAGGVTSTLPVNATNGTAYAFTVPGGPAIPDSFSC